MVKCNKLNQTPQYSAKLIENNTKDFCKMPAENGKPFQHYKLHANFLLCKNYTVTTPNITYMLIYKTMAEQSLVAARLSWPTSEVYSSFSNSWIRFLRPNR